MKINLIKSVKNTTGATLVLFSSQNTGKKFELKSSDFFKKLSGSTKDQVLTGKEQECVSFREINFGGYRHLIVVGLGQKPNSETVRQASAAVYGAAKGLISDEICIDLSSIKGISKGNAGLMVQALTEGLLLSSYEFNELKSKKNEDNKEAALQFYIETNFAADSKVKKSFEEALILAGSVNFARRLGDMPGNLMTPSILAKTVVDATKGTKIKATVWDRARIKKEKMGGLFGVGQGSHEEPRFIILEYKGAPSSKKPIVFVGKGLTFDTGGISIKPSAAMEEMKYDMCGGANVAGTMLAIAKLKLKINAYGLIPASENMPGGRATKPGDIHTARNGKTFEVNNTDAEGRLILADALSYGSELKPQLMVDAATLTGAMVVALGNIHTGFFTRNRDLVKKVEKAAETSGELVWNMPLCDFHTKDMKGTFADLSNMSSSKGAGSATAAAFLEQFVGEGIPWAHFDIAGTGWAVGSRLPYCTKKGASGVMVRTFVELARSYQ